MIEASEGSGDEVATLKSRMQKVAGLNSSQTTDPVIWLTQPFNEIETVVEGKMKRVFDKRF